ncbi:Sip1-related alpha-galactosidase [Neobacillus sp. DY30]|uniref:Sip1-related alpha-galactosidase n=1 Tax=Neobacillus sp. DY30 TaxID=3047871 RepID=UPI0024BFA6B1|nr:Sip1-related alpha-galactosidase [Neobacillus sp. DY30]WHX99769.1 Sip1-related alpha-galactosidase [Neobacillus sp. DY30]
MFQFDKKQDELDCLFHNQRILAGIQVSVNLDSHSTLSLDFKTAEENTVEDDLGTYKEYSYHYSDDLETVTAALTFRCYDSFMTTFVNASIKNDELFKKQAYFAPQQAITITIANLMEEYQAMANYQHKDWWTRPFFTNDIKEIPERTQSLLLKNDNSYFHLLPVCDKEARTDLVGTEKGLQISVSPFHGGYDQIFTFAFIFGASNNPFQLVNDNVKTASSFCAQSVLPREEKSYPEILDYLGWCSWDAFYHAVNEEGILTKAEELQQKNLPVKWMMIDDGWSELNGKKLQSFDADQEKFPNGLSSTVSSLKQKFGVNWVGVWHTLAGYWEGIAPDSSLAKSLDKHLYQAKNGSLIPSPNAEEGFGFWHAWHSKLKKDGIDFVKVDSQSAITNFVAHNQSVGEAASGAHTALEASCSLHFNNTVINCMGMAEENIWHRPYSAVSRNSDDFVPQEMNGFKEHALQNAYNSFYHGAFYWGDWDMYWTKNHDDQQNMILRVISGGPIYFSDAVDTTNPEMIWPLVYKDGRIIRCDQPGVPTEDCLFIDPFKRKVPLKIWNSSKGAGVVAAFNIFEGNEIVRGSIGPNDVPNLAGEEFILFDVLTKRHWNLKKEERINIDLAENESSIYLLIPVTDSITPIGLINKFICNHGIINRWNTESGLKLTLKEGGVFAFLSKGQPLKATVNGEVVPIVTDSVNQHIYTIDCQAVDGEVLLEIEIAI